MFEGMANPAVLESSSRKYYTVLLDEGFESIVYMFDFRTGSSSIVWLDKEGDVSIHTSGE